MVIIENIIKIHSLTESTCYVYSWKDFKIDNTTFILNDNFFIWANATNKRIPNLPLSKNQFSKKFAALIGRHDIYRLKIVKHLHTKYYDQSLLSYTASKENSMYYRSTIEYFEEDKKWFDENCPILLDIGQTQVSVSWEDSLNSIHKHYSKYFIEIVCETHPYEIFFTEKTLKNLHLGKPFLLFSGHGSLQALRDRGFRTFSPFIDESYDNIDNPYTRLEMIKTEIDRIASLSYEEIQELNDKLIPTFEHNRLAFSDYVITEHKKKFPTYEKI
jgi:hypothetical protein